jgi:hypothetical protein
VPTTESVKEDGDPDGRELHDTVRSAALSAKVHLVIE